MATETTKTPSTTDYNNVRRAAIADTQRCAEAARHEYRNDGVSDGRHKFSIDLNLTEQDQISLSLVLREALDRHGVSMIHSEIVRQPADGFHPDSHLGKLVDLHRRVDAALHGRKAWNRNR